MGDNNDNNNYRIERRRVVAKATRHLKIYNEMMTTRMLDGNLQLKSLS